MRRERRSAESVRTCIFEPYAQVILLGNSLVYFDDHLVDSMKGNIEDYLDQKTTVKKAQSPNLRQSLNHLLIVVYPRSVHETYINESQCLFLTFCYLISYKGKAESNGV